MLSRNRNRGGTALIALAACIAAGCERREPQPVAAPADAPAPVDPAAFRPLESDAVKDAIHRALTSGETQRWQDGGFSGYAVPSTATDKRGCRAVRYTVDQRPETPFESITACEAS